MVNVNYQELKEKVTFIAVISLKILLAARTLHFCETFPIHPHVVQQNISVLITQDINWTRDSSHVQLRMCYHVIVHLIL